MLSYQNVLSYQNMLSYGKAIATKIRDQAHLSFFGWKLLQLIRAYRKLLLKKRRHAIECCQSVGEELDSDTKHEQKRTTILHVFHKEMIKMFLFFLCSALDQIKSLASSINKRYFQMCYYSYVKIFSTINVATIVILLKYCCCALQCLSRSCQISLKLTSINNVQTKCAYMYIVAYQSKNTTFFSLSEKGKNVKKNV